MYIIDTNCWKCNHAIKVALIRSDDIDKRDKTTSGPETFNDQEVELARSKGVIILNQFSATMKSSYLANTCTCGAFVGQSKLFIDYLVRAQLGELAFETFDL
jgi:hypothetical protein